MPTTALGDPTLFVIAPDGEENSPMALTESFATAVMAGEDGTELRAALRDVPVRTLEFTPAFTGSLELMRFRALWLGAAERLRYTVPLWTELLEPTAIPDPSTITVDTRHRGLAHGQRCILWQSEDLNELVTLDEITDDGVTLEDPVENTYAAIACSLVPVMNAWLEPPTIDQRSHLVEVCPLTFREEVEVVAGIDPDVGAGDEAVVDLLSLTVVDYGTAWVGRKFATWEARAFDAAGQRIPRPPIVWTITTVPGLEAFLDPPTRYSTPNDGQQFHLEWQDGTTGIFIVTATLGGLTQTVGAQ